MRPKLLFRVFAFPPPTNNTNTESESQRSKHRTLPTEYRTYMDTDLNPLLCQLRVVQGLEVH